MPASTITRLRKQAGMTQAQLAEKLGGDVSRQRVGHWERGYRHPPTAMLRRLADALGCTVDELVDGEDL